MRDFIILSSRKVKLLILMGLVLALTLGVYLYYTFTPERKSSLILMER